MFRSVALLLGLPAVVLAQFASVDWPVYGGSWENTHYTAVDQIGPSNVSA